MYYSFWPEHPDEQSLEPLRRLYPKYTEEELYEAYENLLRYVKLGWRIAERLDREEPGWYERMKKEGKFDHLPSLQGSKKL